MKRALTLILFLCIVSVVAAQSQPSILFIGNSYTHMNAMPKTFEKITTSLNQPMYVEMNAKSNHTLYMHAQRQELFDAINSRKWDFIIIQPYSRELVFDDDSLAEATMPYFSLILDSIYKNNACTNVLLYQTWGYRDGFDQLEEVDTYEEMNERLDFRVHQLSDQFNIGIVPVGQVWNKVLKERGIDLYKEDGSHPNELGSYLIASTFYVSLFKKPMEGAYSGVLDFNQVKTIQDIAYDYVLTHVDVCKLKLNSYFITKEPKHFEPFNILCKANFPKADSLAWYMGNGSVITDTFFRYSYALPGDYVVNLKVFDSCGVRSYFYPLNFALPPDRKKKKRA
jgi:hypothetical protein